MADIAIFRINYKSDFILTLNSDAGWLTPFCVKFWTGAPSNGYFAGFDGENYVNCRVGDEPTKLLVMFDDHHMLVGPLRMQIVYHTTIEEFPGRQFDEVTNVTNVTVDIDGTEYQVMLDFTGESGAEIDFSMPSSGVMSVNGKIGYVTLNAEDVGAQPTIEDLATIRSGASEGATAVQPDEMTAALATKQDVIEDLATIRSGAAAGATAVQPAALQEGLAGKQDTISDLSTIRSGAAAGATAVQPAALTPIESALQAIEAVIPSAASSQNQLADKNFVNSSISTNTANFVGTYNSLAELQAVQNPTNNDYGFVIETDAQGNEYYDRYKYVASSQQWLFEYKVESTPFTAAQWAAIQSGITSALVTKLNALPTNAELQQTLDGKADAADIPTALSQLSQDYTHRVVTDAEKSTWNGKQNAISDLATIRSGAAAGATAVQPATLQEGLATKQNVIEDLSTIRSGAAAGATAVQPNEMTAALAGKQNVIEDLATIRSGAAAGANAVQPAAMNTALAAKQDTLTFDNTPTDNSDNPVKSGGIKTALDAKQTTISTVNVTVDNNTGTPSGSASVSGSTLSLSFQNLKGATGATGATGPQGPQGERGLPGESGVTGDVSGFTVIQTIDPSATYGPTDIAGAATVQATNAELTELSGNIYTNTTASDIYIDGNTKKWAKATRYYCRLIPITAGSTYLITAGTGNAQYTFLTSNSYTQNSAVSTWATGYTSQLPVVAPGTSAQATAPSDAQYLYILCSTNGTDRNHTVREIISKIDNIDSRLDSIESKFTESDGEAITIISGGYWHKDYGRFYEESAYSYTNAIRVTPGQRIKVSVSVGAACYGVAGSSTSTFSTNTTPLVGASTQVTDYIMTIPAGINYIFISSRNENFSTPFTPSAEFLAYSWLDIKIADIASKKCQPNVLAGKKLVTLGDSITQGQVINGTVPENPWPVLVANALGMELVNFGIGGSTIGTCANYGGTFASVADFNAATKDTTKYYVVMTGNQTYSDYRYNGSSWVTTTIAMRTPLVDRYDLMDNDADVILVAGGTNDFQYNWAEIGEITDNVKTTFKGALNVLCNGLITKYPQKCIIFMTPIKRCQTQQAAAANSDTTAHRGGSYGTIDSQNDFGKTLKEYGDIIKEMCARYSIPVIDMYAECMLNPQLTAQSSLFDSYKTHPYQAGHNMMARLVVGKLREIFGANYT